MLSLYSRAVRLSIQGPRFVGPVISRGKKKKAGKKSGGAPAYVDPEVAAMVDLPKYEASMQKTIETLQTNFSRIRSGGASPAMLDGVVVEAYGTSTALDNLAQVSAKDGRNLLVNVYDEHTTTAIEKAIRGAGLNLNPVKEGQTKLRVPIPKQTEKAKESMAKLAVKDAETARVATRMVRRKAMDAVKGIKEDISKDNLKRMEKIVQEMSEKYIDSISQSLDEKVKAIHIG